MPDNSTAADNTNTEVIENKPADEGTYGRSGLVNYKIFDKEVAKKDGTVFTAYDVSIDRSYEENGEWKYTKNKFNVPAEHLLSAAQACIEAHQKIGKLRSKTKTKTSGDQ